jgi:hypothetical protein
MMPPQGAPQPDAATRGALVSWLTTSLDRAGRRSRIPAGRAAPAESRRVRQRGPDLLALDVDPSTLLRRTTPHGFDNVGDVLGVSPVLLERFMEAANKVSALAIGDPDSGVASDVFRIRQDASQDTHSKASPSARSAASREGHAAARRRVSADREDVPHEPGVTRGLEYEHEVEIRWTARVHTFRMGGEADFKANLVNMTKAGDAIDERGRIRLKLTAGPHIIGAAFVARSEATNPTRMQPFVRSSTDTRDTSGHPHFEAFTVTGPYKATGSGDTPSRRRIFSCHPTTRAQEDPCARQIIARLARLACRGDATDVDLQRLFAFYEAGRKTGTFETGIQRPSSACWRAQVLPAHRAGPGGPRARGGLSLGDRELASRLSFFLWSSMPDTQLLDLAAQNKLHTPAVLASRSAHAGRSEGRGADHQLRRPVAVSRNLKNMQPNSEEFPTSTTTSPGLRARGVLFFRSIVREDRNVLDLMTADYTFLNERLAQHYGIPNVHGSHFRRVVLRRDAQGCSGRAPC